MPPKTPPTKTNDKVSPVSSPVRTEGQRLLRAVGSSLSAIAKATGASKSTAGDWKSGNKIPSPALRAKLMDAYSIPVESWDQSPSGDPVAPKPASKATTKAEPATTLEEVMVLIEQARTQLARTNLVSSERVKLTDSVTRLLSLKHRLERDRDAMEDAIVRRHPLWQRIRTVLVETLVAFPDAAKAVADRLEELDP